MAGEHSSGRFPLLRLLTRPFVLLIIAVCLGAHAVNLFVLAPRHLRGLGLGEASIGIVQGAFPLASLVAMLLLPRIVERFGRRRTLVGGMLLCAAGSLSFLVAADLALLVPARAIQGMGWASVLVSSTIITSEIAPPGRLGEALGIAGVLTLLAMAMGPLLGEALVAWGERSAHDPPFASLFVAAGLFALAGGAVGRSLPETGGTRRAEPRDTPRFRPTWTLLAAFFGAAMGFGAVVSFLADYTHLVGVASMAPFFQSYVAMAIGARLTLGSLSDRIGRKAVIVPALLVQGVALGGLAWLKEAWLLWPLGVLFGLAQGLYYPALQALIVERSPADVRPRAIASSNFAFAAGMALSAFTNGAFAARAGYPAVYLEVGLAAWAGVALVLLERPPPAA
jgi:MFS family permease